jgi:PAS domain S-box-containing protein
VFLVQGANVVDVNEMFLTLVGRTREQVLGSEALQLFAPEDHAEILDTYTLGQPMPQRRLRIRLLTSSGERILVDAFASERSGDPPVVLIVVSPVVLYPRESSPLLPSLADAARLLRYQNSEFQVLQVAAEALHRAGLWAAIFRVDDEEMVLEHIASPVWSQNAFEQATHVRALGQRMVIAKSPMTQKAFRERRAVDGLRFEDGLRHFYEPLVSESKVIAAQALAGVRDGVALPVFVGGKPHAVVMAYASRLNSDDVAALELFAAELSAALENVTFVARLERRNQELSLLNRLARESVVHDLPGVLDLAANTLAQLTGARVVTLYLVEPGASDLVLSATAGQGPGPFKHRVPIRTLKHAVKNGQVFALEGFDAVATIAGCANGLAQPLMLRERLAGLLCLGRDGQEPFDISVSSLLDTTSLQLAVSLENAQLLGEAQRRVLQLTLVNDVSRKLARSLDPVEQMGQTLESLLGKMRLDAGAVVHWPGRGPPRSVYLGLDPVLGEHLSARLLARGRPGGECETVSLTELGEDGEALIRSGFRRLVVAWFDPEHEARGALWGLRRSVNDTGLDSEFEPEASNTLALVSAQLGLALDRAALFSQAQRRLTDLELVQEVGEAIAGTLDLSTVLETSSQRLARITGAFGCELFLVDTHQSVLRWSLSSAGTRREPLVGPGKAALQAALNGRRPEQTVESGRAMLALPLLHRDRLVGVALLTSSSERLFTAEEIVRGQVITNQVAAAVENARLFDDLKRSYEALGQAQGQLVKRERLAALGELAAVVAHEVRNPLGVIFNSVTSLKRLVMATATGDTNMLLDIVGEEADRLNRIVGDLLDFARSAEPAPVPTDLERLLEEVLETARGALNPQNLTVVREVDPQLPKVPTDERLMRQALLNLALNALQAMPRGGQLTLRVRPSEHHGKQIVRIEVEDTGVGIPSELGERIFEPFFTTKATGTGLGLAVVRRIVEDHRGEVEVNSAVGRGTCVSVLLPLRPGEGSSKINLEPISLTP